MIKKIVFIASNPFNPEPRAEKQIRTLVDSGYDVSIIGWDRENKNKIDNNLDDIPKVLINIKSSFGSGLKTLLPLMAFQLCLVFNLIKLRNKYDAIHCVNFDTALVGLIVGKMLRKKIVYDIYDYYVDAFSVPRLLKTIIKRLDTLVIEKVDVVILPLESRVIQIRPAKAKKLVYIYNTPQDEYFPVSKNEKLTISYIGVLQEGRYIEEILNFVDTHDEVHLNIAGFGKPGIIAQIESTKNCVFYGKVNYFKGLEISASSDILICIYDPNNPNHKYSAPNKFYEAMMLGKPIIVAKGMGIDEYVFEKDTGFVIDYSDTNSLTSILNEINLDRENLLLKGQNARKSYEKNFSWELMKINLLQLYREL